MRIALNSFASASLDDGATNLPSPQLSGFPLAIRRQMGHAGFDVTFDFKPRRAD